MGFVLAPEVPPSFVNHDGTGVLTNSISPCYGSRFGLVPGTMVSPCASAFDNCGSQAEASPCSGSSVVNHQGGLIVYFVVGGEISCRCASSVAPHGNGPDFPCDGKAPSLPSNPAADREVRAP